MRRFMGFKRWFFRLAGCFVGPFFILALGCGGSVQEPAETLNALPKKSAPGGLEGAGTEKKPLGHCFLEDSKNALEPPELDKKAQEPSQKNIKAWIEKLADPALRGRYGGSPDSKKAAAMLARAFLQFNWSGPPSDHEMCRAFEREGVRDQNVVAHLQGNCPKGCKTIVVGAHYDGQGVDALGHVYPSADDNASGVSALMEAARLLSLRRGQLQRDLVFIAFGAEERNVLGAKAYVHEPTVDFKSVALMINMDMVGRQLLDGMSARKLLGRVDNTLGFAVSSKWGTTPENWVLDAARSADVRVIGVPEELITSSGYSSDSVPFSQYVPTVFFSTAIHADYHSPTDTPDKIDAEQTARVVLVLLAMLRERAY